jgi:putative flippase GtrA
MKDSITTFIDFFHPPFKRFIDTKTFRYLACGSANTSLDIFLYFILMAFVVTFPFGFMLMRHVVFTDSILRGRIQLARYFTLVMINLLLNYVFLKLFVEHLHIYPTPAKIITTVIIVIFSYLMQRHFTFKSTPVSKD